MDGYQALGITDIEHLAIVALAFLTGPFERQVFGLSVAGLTQLIEI